jgi:hypothetical protein
MGKRNKHVERVGLQRRETGNRRSRSARVIPAFSHSIREAKTIAVSQLRAIIADCATKSADNFRHHF